MADARLSVQVDAIGNFSNVIGEVGKFRTQLQNLKLPDKLTAKLEKGFDNVESKVSHFQSLLNKGINTKGDFSKLISSARAADKALVDLKEDVRAIGDKDLHIAVANSTEIQKAEQALNKLINAGDKLKNFGTSKGTGIISETEVARIQKLANTSEGLKKKFQDVDKAFKTGNIEQASIAIEKLIAHVQRYQAQMNNSKATPGKGDTILKWATDVRQALNGMVSEVEKARASFNQLQTDKFNQMKTSINGITTGLGNATNGVRQFISAESEAAARTNQLNEQVGHLRTQANYFFGLQNMGRLIARGIREAAESVRDLDKAMTETAVVTDFSVSDMWKMLPEYTALANKLGATTQGAYETMTLYFQQGLNKQQTFEIGEETMKMARIAGLDYAQTTNMMTAALRGFNMELNQTSAKRVNDVYSELAAITASDTRELGLAMERTASIAHSAGMDFGNTTAFLAQMIETTREAPENLGTAMKTIVARFQELKQNPYEISEVEGEEVDYNRVDKALKSIGVDLMDNKDKFRDLDDVFMDISERWDGLSQTQQRYVATIAAGARQQSRFLAMVQNYDRLKQLTDAAANSEGASEVQFAKTLESYEAKVNKLKNAWQQYTMSLANNQAIKKTVDWLKDLITFGNKIIKTFGKIGSVFGDFGQGLAEMAASFGLGALGFKGLKGGANLGLRLLGGMTVKGATTSSGMFPGGSRGSAGFASKISNPIVAAINRLTAVVSGQASKMPSFQNAKQRSDLMKERRQNLYGVTKRTEPRVTQPGSLQNMLFGPQYYKKVRANFSASDIRRQFSGLEVAEQRQIYKSVPAIRKALQNGYAEAYKGLNLDKAGQEALTRHFNQVDEAVKSGKISATDAFRHLYNPASVAQAIDNPEVTKALNSAVENQMKSWGTQKHAKISARLKQMADKRGLEGEERQQFYKNQKRQIAGQELGISSQSTAQLGKVAGAMTAISSKAALAGQSVMGLGMALDSIGMHGAGAALTTVGNGLIGIGMAAEGASAGVGKLKAAFKLLGKNPMGAGLASIAAIGVAVAGGFAIAHKKMVKDAQQAGKKVVDTYKDTVDKTEKELKNLSDYEENWATWSAGVDENGNNVSLGTGEYEDYLKAVKEITQAHPELIKGYNALGNAIVDNNTVLKEAKKLTQDEADRAKKEYLSSDSYEKIKTRQKSTKRWHNANDGSTIDNILWGQAGNATSNYEIQAQEALDAMRQIKGADKILKDFGVTWDETGAITAQGIELIRTKGSDLVNAIKTNVGDSDKELNKLVEGASDKVATFGKTVKGLEEVSKDTYDWGIEYASSKGYDKIDSGLIAPFQTAIERLAEKGLDESEFTSQIDAIGQKYQDLGGHLKDFQEIQKQVEEAQTKLGESADFDAYTDTVEVATAQMDSWIAELRSSKEEADHILAEWLVNQKTAMMDYSQRAMQDLSEGLNQDQALFKSSAEASKRYESIKEQITDYASGLNSMKAILDDAMTDQNLEGNGSLVFEQASKSVLGEDFVKNNADNMNKVKAQMKEYQGWLQDSEGNARSLEDTYISFWDHITQKAMESPDKTIEGIDGKLSDFFIETEHGLEANNEKWSKLTDEQMGLLAEKGFDMSADWMSSMLNIGRQLGYYSSANMDMIKQGLIEQNGQGAAVGADSTVYKRESDLREESALAMNSEAETEQIVAEAGKAGIELIGDVSSMSGKAIKTMMDNLEISGKKSGEKFGSDFVKQFEELNYNKDEVSEAIDKALGSDAFSTEEKASLQNAQANLTEIWDNILADKEIEFGEEDKSAEERTASAAEGIESMLGQQLAAEGKLSKEAYTNAEGNGLGYAALENVLGKSGKDTMAQIFASGTDRAGNKLTDEQYNDYLNQLQNLRNHYQDEQELLKTNAAKAPEGEKKWWEDQAGYYQQAVDYLDTYIQKGQDAHQDKMQQNEEENESNNEATQNKLDNDQKEKESEQDKKEAAQQEDSETMRGKDINPELEQYEQLQAKFNELKTQEPIDLNSLFGLSSTDALSESAIRFSGLINGLDLSKQQVESLSTALQSLNPDQLQNLDNITLSNILGQINLTDKQLEKLNTIDPSIEVTSTADTSEADEAIENIDEETKEPKEIKVVTTAERAAQEVNKIAQEQQPQQTGTEQATRNLEVKYVTTISNEGAIKAYLDSRISAIVKDAKSEKNLKLNASITVDYKKGKQAKADKSKATVDYKKGKQENAEDKSAKVNYTLGKQAAPKDKTATVNYKLGSMPSIDTSKTITLSPKFVGTWEKTVKLKPSEAKGKNNKITYSPLPSIGSAAKGTKYGRIGPKDRGGLTLTGEEGFEIAWLPDESRSMILGANGPQMLNLPNNAVIYTHEQSKKIIKQKSIPAGSHRKITAPKRTESDDNNKKDGKGGKGGKSGKNNKSGHRNNDNGNTSERKKVIKKAKALLKKYSKVAQVAGKVNYWWWNMGKKVEQTQRKIDKLFKDIEKQLKNPLTKLNSLTKQGGQYIRKLNQQISLNKKMRNAANKSLTRLNVGDSTVQKRVKNRQAQVDKDKTTLKNAKKELKKAKGEKAKKKAQKKVKSAEKKLKKDQKRLNKARTGVNYATISYDVKVNKAQEKYEKALKKYQKAKTKKDRKKAKKELDKAGKELKKKKTTKKTKKTKVNLSPYIKYDSATGEYQIDYNKINKKFGKNKSKAKAVGDAAQKKLDDYISKRNAAEDKIAAAEEKIEEYGQKIYETFYGWENELTKILDITKQIEAVEAQANKMKTASEASKAFLGASTEEAFLKFGDGLQYFKAEMAATATAIKKRGQAIEEQKSVVQKAIGTTDENAELSVVNQRVATENETISNIQKKINSLNTERKKKKTSTKRKKAIDKEIEALKTKLNQAKEDKAVDTAYQTSLKQDIGVKEAARKYITTETLPDGSITVLLNSEALERDRLDPNKTISHELYEGIKKYYDDLLEQNEALNKLYEEQIDALAGLAETLQDLREQYADRSEELVEAIEDEAEAEIDKFEKLSSAITDSLKDLLDEVKNKLEERRRQEDNKKTRDDISKKQQRLAALRANTAGGNQVEIAQLEKEIADAQQDYQRTLEDQLLDKLQSQADEAAKQRERQIELMRMQLDVDKANGKNIALVNLYLSDVKTYSKEIEKLWKSKHDFDNQTDARKKDLEGKLATFMEDISTNGLVAKIAETEATIKKVEEDKQQTEQAINETANTISEGGGTATYEKTYEGAKKAKANNVSAAALKESGFSADLLIGEDKKNPVYSYTDLRLANYTPEEIKNTAGIDAAKQAYLQRRTDAEANKQMGVDEFLSVKNYANVAGLSAGTYIRDLAATDGLTWETVLKTLVSAASKGKFGSYQNNMTGLAKKLVKTYAIAKPLSANALKTFAAAFNKAFSGYKFPNSGKQVTYDYTLSLVKKKDDKTTPFAFASGGLANYTGPAWLDGTPSKPELVLNPTDTKNFLALRDVLGKAIKTSNTTNNAYGNNTYEININVDHINNDYDVDRIAERVKKDIVKSASYRNVTQVRNFR